MNSGETAKAGSTVVITHRVKTDRHTEYEIWLGEIGGLCRAAPGLLDWQIVRPIPGLSETYTIIVRFSTEGQLAAWMNSTERRRLIEQVRPLLQQDDRYTIQTGLDFLFTPTGTARVSVRWKQFVVTWSAIYPLAFGVPLVLAPVLQRSGIIEIRALTTLVVTGVIVALMVYVVMPRYTKAVREWLFR